MRVKKDHPNTTERPQQVQQRPVNQVSEELESRFNNALKPTQAESEHESATSRLFAAVLNADKLDGSQEHPENLKDQPANEKSDADLHPEKPSHDLSEREAVQVLDNKDQNEESHSETSERPAKEPHSDTAKPVKLRSLMEQSVGSKETDKSQPLASNSAAKDTAAIVDSKAALFALEEKVKAVKHIELRHPSSESDAKLHQTAKLSQSTAQGDIILKNVETHAPQNRAQDVNELINKLVDKIYVSLPSANDKEVRLLLNEGKLKGGEISIKKDSSGYSVLIKQEQALSLINQTAKQELTELLKRLGIDQPIRIAVSEQMNQQQDQQRSRQQRSIYDEWKPEDE